MRVLIITQYYAPEPVIYPHQLAKGLKARGHEVEVLTGFPNYPRGNIYDGYKQKILQCEQVDGVQVLRLPLYPDHSLSSIKRSLYYLSFACSSCLLGPLFSKPADIIFVFHPITLGFAAWIMSLCKGIPFVYNIQDMFPESLGVLNMSSESPIYKGVDRFAKFIYRKASAISVISPGFKQNLIRKGIPEEKIHVIYNWADDSVYTPVKRDADFARQFDMEGKFNIIFAGNMGPPQGLESVIEAAALLKDLPDVRISMIGDGNSKPGLEKLAQDRGLKNINFIARQPASRMPLFYALADALIVHLVDDPLFAITIPSKIPSYLACGRPIILALKGDAADMILDAGAGIIAKPSNPDDIAQAIRTLHLLASAEREAMGARGRDYYLRTIASEIQIGKYEDLFLKLVNRSKGN